METKQEVFDEAMYHIKSPDVFMDLSKRYVTATDGNPDCPYCHGTKKHTNSYGRFNGRQRITHSMRFAEYNLVTMTSGQPALIQPINYCPMCGRRLTNGD